MVCKKIIKPKLKASNRQEKIFGMHLTNQE